MKAKNFPDSKGTIQGKSSGIATIFQCRPMPRSWQHKINFTQGFCLSVSFFILLHLQLWVYISLLHCNCFVLALLWLSGLLRLLIILYTFPWYFSVTSQICNSYFSSSFHVTLLSFLGSFSFDFLTIDILGFNYKTILTFMLSELLSF